MLVTVCPELYCILCKLLLFSEYSAKRQACDVLGNLVYNILDVDKKAQSTFLVETSKQGSMHCVKNSVV